MRFEKQVRRRLTEPGTVARKNIEEDIPDLPKNGGMLLPNGHIVINHPEQGIILLRADHVTVYTPVQESADPLDSILGKPPTETVVLDDDEANGGKSFEDEEALISPEEMQQKSASGDPGAVTGGAGFTNS